MHRDTVEAIVRAGAEILVAGSAIFEHGDPRKSAKSLLEFAQAAASQVAEDCSGVLEVGASGEPRKG